MSIGLYELNGNVSYSMDLEKKLKRKKNAIIIKIYDGDETDLNKIEKILQQEISKYNKINKKEEEEEEEEEENTNNRYYFYNTKTKESIISIYPTLDDLKNIINVNDYERRRID